MMRPPEDQRIWDNLFAYTGLATYVITAWFNSTKLISEEIYGCLENYFLQY
jgi:hypothetical protein